MLPTMRVHWPLTLTPPEHAPPLRPIEPIVLDNLVSFGEFRELYEKSSHLLSLVAGKLAVARPGDTNR